jgi:hypothetical protein
MWTYEQSTGKLYDPFGNLVSTGYAGGNCGNNPEGVNNPDLQAAKCVGPLPVGVYTFGTPEEGTHLGAFAIPLIPDPANNMFGRGSFFCHGDNTRGDQSASEGCIIQSHTTRAAMWASSDHQIQVISTIGA